MKDATCVNPKCKAVLVLIIEFTAGMMATKPAWDLDELELADRARALAEARQRPGPLGSLPGDTPRTIGDARLERFSHHHRRTRDLKSSWQPTAR